MEKPKRCPHCGRNLTENEIYCYFCEMDINRLSGEKQKSKPKRRGMSKL